MLVETVNSFWGPWRLEGGRKRRGYEFSDPTEILDHVNEQRVKEARGVSIRGTRWLSEERGQLYPRSEGGMVPGRTERGEFFWRREKEGAKDVGVSRYEPT